MVVQAPLLGLPRVLLGGVLCLIEGFWQLLGELIDLLQKVVSLVLILNVLKMAFAVHILAFGDAMGLELVAELQVVSSVFPGLVLRIDVVISQNRNGCVRILKFVD